MAEFTKEQARAVYHEKGNILVSASAGSGKTHTMIERVKRLILEKGVSVNQILAVTFTESAAADMKEKLKKALTAQIDKGDEKTIVRELNEIPTADISTLHAFCGRLIRQYFFAVGLSPDFKIIDESESAVMRNECIEKTFKEFYDGSEEWFYTLVDRHAVGRTDANLKELILSAYAFCDSEADPEILMDKYVENYSENGFNALITEYKKSLDETLEKILLDLTEALETFKLYQYKKATDFTASLIGVVKELLGGEDIYVVKGFENFSLRLDVERKLDPTAVEYKEIVASARDTVKDLCKKFAKHITDKESDIKYFKNCARHTEWLVKVLKRFGEIYTQEKREENVLDFNDLEHFALKILRDGQIRETVRKKYEYVFVDEYQDTNGVQEEIINLLSNDNLFMVGDIKQSIYGFRGCRPDFFDNKFIRMQALGQDVVQLNDNFRSAQKVIDTVNAVFNYCMVKKYFGSNYKGNSELKSGGVYPKDKIGRAELHFLQKREKEKKSEEEPRLYDILEQIESEKEDQTANIASLLTEIINDELTKTYYDAKEGKEKQVTYGDIAILTRSKNSQFVLDLVKGLNRHGIPVSSDVKENVCDFPEISTVVNAMRLVDCFLQDIPLASTLKSPIGGFTDGDFYEIVDFYRVDNQDEYGSFCDAFTYYINNADTPLAERLKDFKEYFDGVRMLSDFVGAEGVMNKLVKDKDLDGFLLAEKNGRIKFARLKRLISASVSGGKRLTVKEFLHKVDTCPDAFGFSECGEENTVKAMTIHASKGLEFPVVIVCGLERAMNDEDEHGEILFSRDYGFAVKRYDDALRTKEETLLRGVIKEQKKRERLKEEMRLFYVALTRAKYSLHLTFEGKEDCRKSEFVGAEHFIDYVPEWIDATRHKETDFDFTNLKKGVETILIGKADQKKMQEMLVNFSYVYPHTAETELPLKTDVTAAAKTDDGGYRYVLFDEPSPDPEKGIIAHKILEYYDFKSSLDVYEQTQLMVKGGLLTEQEKSKINLDRIAKALGSGALQCVKGLKTYREKTFICAVPANLVMDSDSLETVVMQGMIDLLALGDEHAVVVDYKYSALEADSLERKYKKQLDLYAYAVEKVLNKRVTDKIIINVFTGDVVYLT
ncbi:MAG: UvrD-helicase domain-containing protein [Clostridia bacterium]|nr:UvrD-helicase domain-containing protein [Clostridia bacterium]